MKAYLLGWLLAPLILILAAWFAMKDFAKDAKGIVGSAVKSDLV